MFGHWSDSVDRFALLKRTHPKLYTYCMDKLGLRDVISYIDKHVKRPNKQYKQIDLFDLGSIDQEGEL